MVSSDANFVYEVRKETWLNTYPDKKHNITKQDILKKFQNKEERIKKIKHDIKTKNYGFNGLVIEVNSELVGFIITFKKNEKLFIISLYILPRYQNYGLGSRLLKEILRNTHDDLWLEVAIYNQKAINFYRKFGFKLVPNSQFNYKLTESKNIPVILMMRKQGVT